MISIYCSEKLDGIASAAIVLRHATLSKLPSHFGGFLHPDTLSEELKDIAQQHNQLIFLLDTSFTPEHLSLFDDITKNNKIVYWNANDPASILPPAKLTDKAKENTCSAELTGARFLPNDKVAKQLALLAHEVKFWQLNDERSTKLSDLIQFSYPPTELIETLSKGILWNEKLEQFHSVNNEKKLAAMEDLMKTLIIKPYLSHRFGFTLAQTIVNSADACTRILDGHAGVDVAVVLYRDGRMALRRRDECTLDVKALAELFNGGGQPFAAGARLSTNVTKENFVDILFQLDQAFKKFFVSVPSKPDSA